MRIYDINRHDSKEISINRVFFDDIEAQFTGVHSSVMLNLTLLASERTKKQGRIFIPRGAVLTSIPKIAKSLGLGESKARGVIETLEQELFLKRVIYNTTTVFIVRDYDYAVYTDREQNRAETRVSASRYYNLNKSKGRTRK